MRRFSPPAAAAVFWPGLCRVIARLRDANTLWHGQIGLVRDWYQPLLERLYDYWASRAGDLDQLEQIASGWLIPDIPSFRGSQAVLGSKPKRCSGDEASKPQLHQRKRRSSKDLPRFSTIWGSPEPILPAVLVPIGRAWLRAIPSVLPRSLCCARRRSIAPRCNRCPRSC
jgi:hypothetical protein